MGARRRWTREETEAVGHLVETADRLRREFQGLMPEIAGIVGACVRTVRSPRARAWLESEGERLGDRCFRAWDALDQLAQDAGALRRLALESIEARAKTPDEVWLRQQLAGLGEGEGRA